MKKYFQILKNIPLFSGISEDELMSLFKCMNAVTTHYPKGSFIFMAGNSPSGIGIVCQGSVQVMREDLAGNRTILTKLKEGDLFGEVFACAQLPVLPVSVAACEDCTILLVDYRRIITTCSNTCTFHNKLIENMLGIIAKKNLMLNQKIEVLSARSTRDKLMTYLSAQAVKAGSRSIHVPFNRQELADYLSVDRSAMSAELGRMRDEGIIRYHKNDFELLFLR